MKKIENYLSFATHYLDPVSCQTDEENRKIILNFCKKYGLDEKLLILVEKDLKWQKLANRTQIRYFVDFPNSITPKPVLNIYQPDISLRIFDSGSVPVIKITNTYNILTGGHY